MCAGSLLAGHGHERDEPPYWSPPVALVGRDRLRLLIISRVYSEFGGRGSSPRSWPIFQDRPLSPLRFAGTSTSARRPRVPARAGPRGTRRASSRSRATRRASRAFRRLARIPRFHRARERPGQRTVCAHVPCARGSRHSCGQSPRGRGRGCPGACRAWRAKPADRRPPRIRRRPGGNAERCRRPRCNSRRFSSWTRRWPAQSASSASTIFASFNSPAAPFCSPAAAIITASINKGNVKSFAHFES